MQLANLRLTTKYILQDTSSELYMRTLEIWTSDPSEAIAFDTLMDAAMFCAAYKIRGFRFATQEQVRRFTVPQQTDLVANFPYC